MKNQPTIEAITEKPFFTAGVEQTADLLIRITPPAGDAAKKRPQMNLSIVLDRSGSMEGEKIANARQAACYCIDQLLPHDRVGVVIFDDVIETLVSNQAAENKEAIKERIARIRARNSTALHEAWVRGGLEVSKNLVEGAVNRVLLITDGLANVGETNTDRIVSQAAELANRGVSTTTIGIGSDFNEDLLIPMAEAGRGNAWHVERPTDMEKIFATEMQGLIAQVGHTVSLGLTPADGVKVVDVLNDFEVTHTGRYKLPNLLAGSTIDAVVRLQVPAKAAGQRYKILDLRLAWTPQGADSSEREVLHHSVSIEYAYREEVERAEVDPRVVTAVQSLMAARARREAVKHLDSGDIVAARAVVAGTRNLMEAAAPYMLAEEAQEEIALLSNLEAELRSPQAIPMSRKKLSYQSYQRTRQSKTLKS